MDDYSGQGGAVRTIHVMNTMLKSHHALYKLNIHLPGMGHLWRDQACETEIQVHSPSKTPSDTDDFEHGNGWAPINIAPTMGEESKENKVIKKLQDKHLS